MRKSIPRPRTFMSFFANPGMLARGTRVLAAPSVPYGRLCIRVAEKKHPGSNKKWWEASVWRERAGLENIKRIQHMELREPSPT